MHENIPVQLTAWSWSLNERKGIVTPKPVDGELPVTEFRQKDKL